MRTRCAVCGLSGQVPGSVCRYCRGGWYAGPRKGEALIGGHWEQNGLTQRWVENDYFERGKTRKTSIYRLSMWVPTWRLERWFRDYHDKITQTTDRSVSFRAPGDVAAKLTATTALAETGLINHRAELHTGYGAHERLVGINHGKETA